jgi:hypothetical protein
MSTLYNKFLYGDLTQPFTLEELSTYSLHKECDIKKKWQQTLLQRRLLTIITFGISSCFQRELATEEEVCEKITRFRKEANLLEGAARVFQRAILKKNHEKQTSTVAQLALLRNFQVSGGIFDIPELASVWLRNWVPDFSCHPRSQIIWKKATDLASHLRERDYYVFFHAHTYPINTHLELCGQLAKPHRTLALPSEIPAEASRKFRSEKTKCVYTNTTDYLQSMVAKSINAGLASDNMHNEMILSCDAIAENSESYESSQHFFKSNESIAVHKTKAYDFDLRFISGFIKDKDLQKYATELFQKTREDTESLSTFGVIRVIAIAKPILEQPRTNYVWRAHPFGKLCRCVHTKGAFGHKEFVATLQKHQHGEKTYCETGRFPQYRILAANLDNDSSKLVFVMDCLTADEKKQYKKAFGELFVQLKKLIKLEHLQEVTSELELQEALQGIDPKEASMHYHTGIRRTIRGHRDLIKAHFLLADGLLTKEAVAYIEEVLT